MKLFFLRHTSLNVEIDVFYGQTDLDVSDRFEEEVKLIQKKIKNFNIDTNSIKVYSSPLKRCIKLTNKLTKNYIVDERIKEMNLGDWEMKKMSSISKKEKLDWENNLLSFKIPNGESNNEFLKRLKSFLEDIFKFNEDALIVCHAGSINGMLSLLTKEPFDKMVKNYWELIKHGSLSLIELKNELIIKKIIGK
ncbi:MAG: phosphoglycerate mutase [Alphaproteobacteria bacterium]|nr:MAG: phosphoglycerate mutase [Alphaproteobacteria bacterium]